MKSKALSDDLDPGLEAKYSDEVGFSVILIRVKRDMTGYSYKIRLKMQVYNENFV